MLSDIQFKKALREATLAVLKSGRVPSLSAIADETAKRLGSGGSPTHKVRLQKFREPWSLGAMNTSLKEVQFDLEVLYSSLLEAGGDVLRRLSSVEASSASQHAQLDRLDSVIGNILFALQNGDSYFEGFSEDFHDYSKLDMALTTPGCVDLLSQTAELPHGVASMRKLVLSHMLSQPSWPVETEAAGTIASSSTSQDAPFRSMFSDMLTAWRHDVITTADGPSSVRFVFPVRQGPGTGVSLTRVQLMGLSESPQFVELEYSTDGTNFLRFPHAGNAVALDRSDRVVNVDFPMTRVELLRVTLKKSMSDKEIDGRYLTSFGLKKLALYSIGRGIEAQLVGKPFSVKDDKTVEKVALSVFENIPPGTDIHYYVAILKDRETDKPVDSTIGQWVPITPLNRAFRKDEAPRVIKSASLPTASVSFEPTVPMDVFETFKGVDYYDVSQATSSYIARPVTDDVVFGTAKMWRGRQAWARKSLDSRGLFFVSEAYVSFTAGPRQKLYAIAKETLLFGAPLEWDGSFRSVLRVSRSVDYRPSDGISMLPPPGLDPYAVPDPLHAIYSVRLNVPQEEGTETLTIHTSGWTRFTKGPIDTSERYAQFEYLCAYAPDIDYKWDDLVTELHSRQSLSKHHKKVVLKIQELSTTRDIEAGKRRLTTLTIGDGSVTSKIDVEVIGSVPMSRVTGRPLSSLTDDALLSLFGKVSFRTTLPVSITGEDATSPSTLYLANQDFLVESRVDPSTGLRSLWVSRSTSSRIPSVPNTGTSVKFRFRYKQDITFHVATIQGNRIFLDNNYGTFPPGTQVEVGYRFVPVGTNGVRKDTLRIAKEPGGALLESGKDYDFNQSDGTVVALAGGALTDPQGTKAGYASFTYEGEIRNLHAFSAWVFVKSAEPVKIRFQELTVDSTYGEKISISTAPRTFVEVSNGTEMPELVHGWHQVMVVSKDPSIFSTSAIRSVAELLDLDGNPVFMQGGIYFSEMVGTRVPMRQVTWEFLRYSVRPSDTSRFAIDSTGHVLVNFQPNEQEDFYTYGYRVVDDGGIPTQTLEHYNETFYLEYRHRPTDVPRDGRVVVRAVLTRDKDADPSLTPKLGGYQVRVG